MWPWKKKQPQERDIDQLIFDIAEYGRATDVDEILMRLRVGEIYSPFLETNVELPSGGRLTVKEGMQIRVPTADMGGVRVFVFFVHQDDQRLGARYGGLSLAEAFAMIEKTPHIQRLVIYNRNISYFGVHKRDFPQIRSQHSL